MVYIYTDGASRGNGGQSAGSFIIEDSGYNELARHSDYFGNMTNNMSEYKSIYNAIKFAQSNGFFKNITSNTIISDSELVINQLKGKYKINDTNLRMINNAIKLFLQHYNIPMAFEWVTRNHPRIKECDKMNNQLLDAMLPYKDVTSIREIVNIHNKPKPSSDGYYYSDFTRKKKSIKPKPKTKTCSCKKK